jgi:hypothetical protein
MPTISTHDESNRELCLTCPLADCDDRSPQCPIHAKALVRWRENNQERKAYFKAYSQENRERTRAYQREYDRSEKRKAYFKARYQAKKMEAK